MPEWFKLILAILICYRLARLIAVDEGPLGIFLNIRKSLGAYDYKADGQAKTNIGRGISCAHCVGVWMAFLIAFFWFDFTWLIFPYWLAITGGQSFLWSLTNDNE